MGNNPFENGLITWDRTRYASVFDSPEYKAKLKEFDDFFKAQGIPHAERRRMHERARQLIQRDIDRWGHKRARVL